MQRTRLFLSSLLLLFFAAGLTGCDTVEGIFENEKEASGIVEAIGESSLTVDAIAYRVDGDTQFDEGLGGLSELSVGDRVEIEYEETNSGRVAIEIEIDDGEDD